jgi:hypothetical protein
MKVKIGNTIYDSNDQPIMLILDEDDKNNIGSMIPENKLYVKFSYSDNLCDEEENQKTRKLLIG